jgi:16S rRNA processing protein RimM
VLEFATQSANSIELAHRFFVELEGLLVPFFLVEDGFRFKTDNTAILTFNDVESEKYAKRMVGSGVYLFKNEMIDSDEIFDSELNGFVLFDEEKGRIGTIEEVNDYSGNIVFSVKFQGNELLVPFNEELLIAFERDKKQITLKLPEGLFEQ